MIHQLNITMILSLYSLLYNHYIKFDYYIPHQILLVEFEPNNQGLDKKVLMMCIRDRGLLFRNNS